MRDIFDEITDSNPEGESPPAERDFPFSEELRYLFMTWEDMADEYTEKRKRLTDDPNPGGPSGEPFPRSENSPSGFLN